jgi:hypothetical protein
MTTTAQVRSAIIDKVDALAGFREIPYPAEYFGRAQNTIAHLGFTVSLTGTEAQGERQRKADQVYLQTDIAVVFAHRLRPHDLSTDINTAHGKETQIIETLLGTYTQKGFTIRYNRTQRRYPDSLEYIIIELNFTAQHTP